MQDLKISVITVCYNAERTIQQCITSVIAQNFKNLEYIVIDGGSTDATLNIINTYKELISILLSEPDLGIYDAINKGITLATGHVIGMLNADDYFADDFSLSAIADAFALTDTDIVYGDLDYVNGNGSVVRKWRSGKYHKGLFNWGWMPPHPTFYCKKSLYLAFGYYSLEYGTAADYELMLRLMHKHHINAVYVDRVLVKMKIGGVSNKNLQNRVRSLLADLKAMCNNGVIMPILTVVLKPVRKIIQYL